MSESIAKTLIYSKDYFYIALIKMFTVEPVDTDDGVYKVTHSDGISLYIHREQQLIGPFASLFKILQYKSGGTFMAQIKNISKSKLLHLRHDNISLYPIESYIEYINQHSKKPEHEKSRCINAINEYLRAVDNSIIRTDSVKDTVDDLKLRIVDIKGDSYRVNVSGIDTPVIFNRSNRFIGSGKFIINFIGIRRYDGKLNARVAAVADIYSSENMFVSIRGQSRIMSMQVINRIIEQLVPSDRQNAIKLKFKRLHEELQRICTEDATVSQEPVNDTASVITDDKSVSECDTITELTSLFEKNMEEPTVNEFNRIVASVANNILLNQTVAVSKIDDGTLKVIMKDISAKNSNKNYIFSNQYLIRAVEVYRLLDKLHDKGIITDIDGDTLTVDDVDFFIDALSYKLMKISERNKESDIDSISVES